MSWRNDDFKTLIIPNERHKANARERVRTYSVNTAFTTLRNLIPTDPADRKLSKIETLRLACSYISHLGSILLTGSCEVQTREEVLTNDLNFAQKSSICTFCVTSAKIKSDIN